MIYLVHFVISSCKLNLTEISQSHVELVKNEQVCWQFPGYKLRVHHITSTSDSNYTKAADICS